MQIHWSKHAFIYIIQSKNMQFKLEMEFAKGFDNYTLEDFELMKE